MTKQKWLNIKEYPFKQHYFKTSAGRMHYVDEGKGNPIVFAHGNPTWSFEFRKLILSLSKNYRCIAPDYIGFGLSDKPTEWSYLPKEHAENFEQLLESLNIKNITLVVGDWGGPIGLSYAITHPDKVKNLVITNTWLWPVNKNLRYIAFSLFMGGLIGRWLIKKHNFFAKFIVKAAFGTKSRLTPEIHQHYIKVFEKPAERKGSWIFPKQIIGSTNWLNDLWNKREILKDKNVLLAWGMKDIAFKEKELNNWIKLFPKAKVVRYEDTGHFVAEEKPNELVVEIEKMLEKNN